MIWRCFPKLNESKKAKNRPEDQPMPIKNERRDIGIKRYGTALQPFNGRNMLQDAYEEALDLAIYLRGCIAEQED